MYMNLAELRKLVSKLNNEDKIKGAYKMKKADIIKELQKLNYDVDIEKKRLVPKVKTMKRKIISLDDKEKTKVVTKTKVVAKPKTQAKADEKIKHDFKFDPRKLKVEKVQYDTDKFFYQIDYKKNNVNIEAEVVNNDKIPNYFYLDIFQAQEKENKPRAKRGEANYYLCKVLETIMKNPKKYEINMDSQLKLLAGRLNENHDQKKLNKYYEKLGFKKEGKPNNIGFQNYTQKIKSFLKNCEKFEPL